MRINFKESVESEIKEADRELTNLLNSYSQLWENISIGEIENLHYRELIEFVNLRAETIYGLMLLLQKNQVSGALSMCRPLLENLLLFKLMTKGHRHYLVRTVPEGKDRRKYVKEMNKNFRQNENQFVRLEFDQRNPRRVLVVYEELKRKDPTDVRIPLHHFLYMDHDPTSAFLKHEKYYSPFPMNSKLDGAFKKIQNDSKFVYDNYLNFGSLKRCLKLNELLSTLEENAVDGHYTFLGGFIHPRMDAVRNLSEKSNTYYPSSGIGLQNPYSLTAVLLGYLYAIHLLASFINLVIEVLLDAPKKHILNSGTESLQMETERILNRFDYFWFLQRQPPYFDRYRAARSDVDFLKKEKHFSKFPIKEVKFDKDIFDRLKLSLLPQSDLVLGRYSAYWSSQAS